MSGSSDSGVCLDDILTFGLSGTAYALRAALGFIPRIRCNSARRVSGASVNIPCKGDFIILVSVENLLNNVLELVIVGDIVASIVEDFSRVGA